MEGSTEDCSPLWGLYQQIVTDMKNSAPMWEDFISKATKLHSALKCALAAIAGFLDAFQRVADAATAARGATKDIGTALTRVCLRQRAIEARLKTFVSTLLEGLVTPLTECAEEWRRGPGGAAGGALSREHARECKRVRAELRRRVHEAQRALRKARRQPPDARRKADLCLQEAAERRQQLEELEERAAKAALVEERARFCHFVTLLHPLLECEVALVSEAGHLQEGGEQLVRHAAEPRTLPPASLQALHDVRAAAGAWPASCDAPHSPTPSARLGLGSRKCSLTSISSLGTNHHDESDSTGSCSTPVGEAASTPAHPRHPLALTPGAADAGCRSPDALHRRLQLYFDNGSDALSVSSEGGALPCAVSPAPSDNISGCGSGGGGGTWPEREDTAQFERAACAILAERDLRPAGAERARPADRDSPVYARPPLPTRCSSLERPLLPSRPSGAGAGAGAATGSGAEMRAAKPSSLPPHLTKEMPGAVYVNMSELASLAAARAQQHAAHHDKACCESSASESSLESSSGYGSQGGGDLHPPSAPAPAPANVYLDVPSEIVTLRRDSGAMSARPGAALSLTSLEEAVRMLSTPCDASPFATVSRARAKPAPPKRRPLSLAAPAPGGGWSRRGSSSSLGKPPPPVRRSSSMSRPQRPAPAAGAPAPRAPPAEPELPPPPAFLLQPDAELTHDDDHVTGEACAKVAEAVKQLTELRHTPASPALLRRPSASTPAPASAPVDGAASAPAPLSSFGPRVRDDSHYGQTGFKLQQEKRYQSNSIYAQPAMLGAGAVGAAGAGGPEPLSPLALRKSIAARSHSADRRATAPNLPDQGGLLAALSAKLSPRAPRRTPAAAAPAAARGAAALLLAHHHNGAGCGAAGAGGAAFLDKLSQSLQQQQRRGRDSPRATTVRDIINAHAKPDPRACHSSLMEQIKRGATLRRNRHCNDRSAPHIR